MKRYVERMMRERREALEQRDRIAAARALAGPLGPELTRPDADPETPMTRVENPLATESSQETGGPVVVQGLQLIDLTEDAGSDSSDVEFIGEITNADRRAAARDATINLVSPESSPESSPRGRDSVGSVDSNASFEPALGVKCNATENFNPDRYGLDRSEHPYIEINKSDEVVVTSKINDDWLEGYVNEGGDRGGEPVGWFPRWCVELEEGVPTRQEVPEGVPEGVPPPSSR